MVATSFFESFKGEHLEDHGLEIERLATISDPAHIKDNELVVNLRQNKYGLVMSKYSFELLLCFLQDNKFMLILRLMNQYITIEGFLLNFNDKVTNSLKLLLINLEVKK